MNVVIKYEFIKESEDYLAIDVIHALAGTISNITTNEHRDIVLTLPATQNVTRFTEFNGIETLVISNPRRV